MDVTLTLSTEYVNLMTRKHRWRLQLTTVNHPRQPITAAVNVTIRSLRPLHNDAA